MAKATAPKKRAASTTAGSQKKRKTSDDDSVGANAGTDFESTDGGTSTSPFSFHSLRLSSFQGTYTMIITGMLTVRHLTGNIEAKLED